MIVEIMHPELEALKATALATMLYGSYARGDQAADSDIDVLQLVYTPTPPQKIDSIVVSFYTARQLSNLAKQGSLFVLHLRTEGLILHDPQSVLHSALDCYVPPISYNCLKSTIAVSSAVLHLEPASLNAQQFSGVISLGLYLLRTLIYLRCVEEGSPAFSLSAARDILGNHPALVLLTKRRTILTKPSPVHVVEILSLVEALLGYKIPLLGSKLEAVAVNATIRNQQAGQLVTRILLGDYNIHYEALVEDEL